MKKHMLLAFLMGALAFVQGCKKDNAEATTEADLELDSLDRKVSYILGFDLASRTKQVDFSLDPDILLMAVRDVESGKDARMSDEEMSASMVAFQAEQQAKSQAANEAQAASAQEEGLAFLSENAEKEGVVTLESGLQYKELTSGDGAVPKLDDTVKVHYRGRLIDGTEFDSSYQRGEPAVFPVSNLIPGWIEALQLMNVGDVWELYVPADLAYGPGGTSTIPPYSTLVFEMDLQEIIVEETGEE